MEYGAGQRDRERERERENRGREKSERRDEKWRRWLGSAKLPITTGGNRMFLSRKRRRTGQREKWEERERESERETPGWAREPLPKRSNYPAIGFDDGALIESINERQ